MINIAVKQFTSTPGARYKNDGDFSGQEFREKFLEPHFAAGVTDLIEIDLDETEGYATSFLEEAFGGLARKFGKENVMKRLKFKSDEDSSLIEEIHQYIADVEN